MSARDLEDLLLGGDGIDCDPRNHWVRAGHLVLRRDEGQERSLQVRGGEAGVEGRRRFRQDARDPVLPTGPVATAVLDEPAERGDGREKRRRAQLVR